MLLMSNNKRASDQSLVPGSDDSVDLDAARSKPLRNRRSKRYRNPPFKRIKVYSSTL